MGEKVSAAGEEKLLAVARQIARTLGRDDSSAADDILQIFYTFDGRSSRDRMNPLDDSLHLLRRNISSPDPIWSSSSSASSFLQSLDHLISAVAASASSSTADEGLLDLLHQAMLRLEDEFRSLLEIGTDSFDPGNNYNNNKGGFDSDEDSAEDDEIPVAEPVTDFDVIIDAIPSGTIGDLHEMAKRMVGAGFGKECCHVYSSCRREFLDESMSRLGLHRFSIEEARSATWNELEEEIERWTKAAAVSLRILFPSERRLCDRIFHGMTPSAPALSFMESCRGCTIQLLNFADSIAIGSRAPERLFKVLDVFETMRDLMPEFETLFSDRYCIPLRNEAIVIWKRLGEAIRGIFMELENLIRRDPAKSEVPGGGLHPITRYVMNYLRAACRSRQSLEQVFENANDPRGSSSSSLSIQLIWTMELLESNLEAKSKVYRDNAMSAMFMMNNEMYLVQKVKDGELGSLLGEDWIRKHTAKVKQYQNNFVRGSWNKVLGALKVDNYPTNTKSLLVERVKTFNACFDEACESQASCVIFDEQLKEDVRSSVAKLLLPPYEGLVVQLQNAHEINKHHMANVKPVREIEALVDGLYRSSSGSGSRK